MKLNEGFVRADSRNLPKVDVTMLLEIMQESDAFNAAEIRGAKILLSSRISYVESAIGYVEVKREGTVCKVRARITPEHKVRQKMYSVMIDVDEEAERIREVTCEDCPASAGGCKHGICFVYWLIKRTEEPAVTDVKCYWKKPTLSEVVQAENPIPAKQFTKKRVFDEIATSITLESILTECKTRKITGTLLTNYSTFKEFNLSDYKLFNIFLRCFLDKNKVLDYDMFQSMSSKIFTKAVINEIEQATRNQSESILWHTLRQYRVTASNVYNVTKCSTADGTLVKSIMGGYKVPETKAIRRGKKLEAAVKTELSKELGVDIQSCGLVLVTPTIGASPDGLTNDCVIEIKCPLKDSTIQNYINEKMEIKPKCKAQIMLQMHATGMKKGLFCIADPKFEENKKITKVWLNYDEAYTLVLIKGAELFWKNFIFHKILECVQ